MKNFLWNDIRMYKITPDVFLEALGKALNIEDVSNINLYWSDISPSDQSIANCELELTQVSYSQKNGKVEVLLFNNDNLYTDERDQENQKFFDEISKHIFEPPYENIFSYVYIQEKRQIENFNEKNNKHLICATKINGHFILS